MQLPGEEEFTRGPFNWIDIVAIVLLVTIFGLLISGKLMIGGD